MVALWRKIKAVKKLFEAVIAQKKVNRTIAKLRLINRPIRVGFYIVSDSCFQFETVFQLMLKIDSLNPKLVVIPNMNLSPSEREAMFDATTRALNAKYPGLVESTRVGERYCDVSSMFDIVATMNPYDHLTAECYGIEYLAKKGIPVLLSRYYQEDGTVWSVHFNKMPELSFLWRFYQCNVQVLVETASVQKLLSRFHRLVVVGEPKIDRLYEKQPAAHTRKTIILAPHHSIEPIGEVRLQLSNFLLYKDLILKLPERYPQIDWVFRPHPLLMSTMISNGYWTESARSKWLERFLSFHNVRYVTKGDYYDMFLNSDGMIQDCGSFLPEYFYVNKPQCYVLKSKEHEQLQFTTYGKSLLCHVYRAYCENDIIDFIDRVILGGKDSMKNERMIFADEIVKFNYPHASESIVRDIKEEFGLK